ncbi:hypothetical protein OIU79_011616 [Salix purpurea]|uniref:Uncharacterized protein n=1 Tax=Salix purpurea TaxID=77065 RepID=A0A9Q0Q1R8_SALPP|nr:hypothetical protein OIU79_011616 [Salix purpurea]
MNRSCSRENPDILIVMIAEKQIMKGGEDDQEREIMGPQKPAREMSDTALKRTSLPPSLPPSSPCFYSCVALLSPASVGYVSCISHSTAEALFGFLCSNIPLCLVFWTTLYPRSCSCWVIAVQQMTRRVL